MTPANNAATKLETIAMKKDPVNSAKKAAANAPIQGSSADIIKVAMVQLHNKLTKALLPARLLLQVHDELVLEVDPTSIEEVKKLVINTMEQAVSLSVPLVVETGVGNNWMEAK